jgi:hypothetical protein
LAIIIDPAMPGRNCIMKKVLLGAIALMIVSVSVTDCKRGSNAPAPQADKFAVVNASGGLNMRSAPTVSAEKITSIPAGKQVKILSLSERKEKVGNVTDYWAQVEYEGKRGWVFNGFLSHDSAPSAGGDAAFQIEVRSRDMKVFVDKQVKGRNPQIQLSPTEFWLITFGGDDGKTKFSCNVICGEGCEKAPVCGMSRMIFEHDKITLYITENKTKRMKCTIGKDAFLESSTTGGTCEDL